MRGYVYVLSNPSMPGLLKVGRSVNGGEKRAKELSTTGVPSPFTVEFEILCEDCVAAESLAHEELAEYRASESREFFYCEIYHAVEAVISGCCRSSEVLCPPYFDDMADLSWAAHQARVSITEIGLFVSDFSPLQIRETLAAIRSRHRAAAAKRRQDAVWNFEHDRSDTE